MKVTMFERYGGFAAINRFVDRFYDKVQASPMVAPFFAGTQMMRLVDHQTKFMASVMGGPPSHSDRQLAMIHAHMDIDQTAFDEVADLLRQTLEEFDVEEADRRRILSDYIAKAPFIVTRTASGEPGDEGMERRSGVAGPVGEEAVSLLNLLDVAVCVVDRRTLEPVFANASFESLFGEGGASSLLVTFPEIEPAAMEETLARGARYAFRRDVPGTGRLVIGILADAGDPNRLICECQAG